MNDPSRSPAQESSKPAIRRFIGIGLLLLFAVSVLVIGFARLDRPLLHRLNLPDPYPPLTEITVFNKTGSHILIKSFQFGAETRVINRRLTGNLSSHKSWFVFFHYIRPLKSEIRIFYEREGFNSPLEVGLMVDRTQLQQCNFFITFTEESVEITDCRESDLEISD